MRRHALVTGETGFIGSHFRKNFLIKFNQLEPTLLEKMEPVDISTGLEHEHKVKVIETEYEAHAVDIPEDLKLVEERMKDDSLFPT